MLPAISTGAVADLGLGSQLRDEVHGETEELRKKRMQEQQQRQLAGPMGSAVTTLGIGGYGATGY